MKTKKPNRFIRRVQYTHNYWRPASSSFYTVCFTNGKKVECHKSILPEQLSKIEFSAYKNVKDGNIYISDIKVIQTQEEYLNTVWRDEVVDIKKTRFNVEVSLKCGKVIKKPIYKLKENEINFVVGDIIQFKFQPEMAITTNVYGYFDAGSEVSTSMLNAKNSWSEILKVERKKCYPVQMDLKFDRLDIDREMAEFEWNNYEMTEDQVVYIDKY